MTTDFPVKNIFIISGPSGAGEDSVIDGLTKVLPVERVTTTKSRAPRPNESQGNPYYFISREEFETKIKNGDFLEYAMEYNGDFAGVTKEEFTRISHSGKIGIWKIEYKGVQTAKKIFPDMIAILLTAPLEVMENRIRRRGNISEEAIQERMAYTKEWLDNHVDIYDYTVENKEGGLEETIATCKKIIEENKANE